MPEPAPVDEVVARWHPRAVADIIRARVGGGELGFIPVAASLAVIWIFFTLQEPAFASSRNVSNLIVQIAVTGTIAIGVVLVLLIGEIDLSVGSVAGLTAALLAVLVVNAGLPWWAGIILMLLAGAAIGAFQGVWTVVLGVPAFIVTLAGFLTWLGVQLRILGQSGTINIFDPNITGIATSFLPDWAGWLLGVAVAGAYAGSRLLHETRRRRAGLPAEPSWRVIGKATALLVLLLAIIAVLNSYRGVPTPGVILLVLVAFFDWITTRTRFGRHLFAVGGNAEAARRAGIAVTRIRIAVFSLASFMAAVGGLIAVARLQAASTQTGGGTLLLEAIGAAVIGGTSLFGGRGSVWAALLGALVLGSVSNGLDLLGQPADVKLIVEGTILLLAVTLDAVARRSRAAAGR